MYGSNINDEVERTFEVIGGWCVLVAMAWAALLTIVMAVMGLCEIAKRLFEFVSRRPRRKPRPAPQSAPASSRRYHGYDWVEATEVEAAAIAEKEAAPGSAV